MPTCYFNSAHTARTWHQVRARQGREVLICDESYQSQARRQPEPQWYQYPDRCHAQALRATE